MFFSLDFFRAIFGDPITNTLPHRHNNTTAVEVLDLREEEEES